MFGSSSSGSSSLATKTAIISAEQNNELQPPALVSVETQLTEIARNEYYEISNEIGFHPAALIKDELIAFLKNKEMGIYDYGEVKTYLDNKFGKKPSLKGWCHTWAWCPLRDIDMGKSSLPVYGSTEVYNTDNGGFIFNRSYHGAVPAQVIRAVRDILKEVKGVHFFVSDVMRARDRSGTDPFLGASAPGSDEIIVIAEWDEPAFNAGCSLS